MKRIIYNKLVRDKIPEIIEQAGQACACSVLSDGDYPQWKYFFTSWAMRSWSLAMSARSVRSLKARS